MDPGWLYTVDEYFENEVNSILTKVVNVLLSDPIKTFTHAEIVFFLNVVATTD